MYMEYTGDGVVHYRVPLQENRGSVEPVTTEAQTDVDDEDLYTEEHHRITAK